MENLQENHRPERGGMLQKVLCSIFVQHFVKPYCAARKKHPSQDPLSGWLMDTPNHLYTEL